MKEINVMEILGWISIIVFIALMAWWVFGDSPVLEQLAFGATFLGATLSWRGHMQGNKVIEISLANNHILNRLEDKLSLAAKKFERKR